MSENRVRRAGGAGTLRHGATVAMVLAAAGCASWAGAGVLSPPNPHRKDAVAELQLRSLAMYPAFCEELHTATDLVLLNSDTIAGDASVVFARRWVGSISAGLSREERAGRDALSQVSVSGGLGFRF